MSTEERILVRLALGPATLAELRAALPADDPDRRALPSMGEPDPFGMILSGLVHAGRVVDDDGLYRAGRATGAGTSSSSVSGRRGSDESGSAAP